MKTKKKILSILISMGIVLSLTACGGEEKSEETTGTKDSITVESTSEIEKETSSIDLETTTQEVTTQEVTTQEVTTQEPTTQEPTTQKPTQEPTQEPTTQEPTTQKPTQEPTTQEPTTQEPTTQEPTTQEPTTQEPTTPNVVVDENRDKYLEAAKKAVEHYSGQAAAFDDVDEDGVPELIFAEYMYDRAYGAYFFVYENGEYKDSSLYISMYEGMRLYKEKATGKYFGLEISDHPSGVSVNLYDFENLKSKEIAYADVEYDGVANYIYIYKDKNYFSLKEFKQIIYAEVEEEHTYIRDMSKVVVWKDHDVNAMIENAYDNYLKSK